MKTETRPILSNLVEFLSNCTVERHEVVNSENAEKTQFISINGIVSEKSISTIVTCQINQGVREYVVNTTFNSNLIEILKTRKKVEADLVNTLFRENPFKAKEGAVYYCPIVHLENFPAADNALAAVRTLHDIASFQHLVTALVDTELNGERIFEEILVRDYLNKKRDLKPFIEYTNSTVFVRIFDFLKKSDLVRSELKEFTNLFSGIPPSRKVIFKCANTLNKVKLLMVSKELRSGKSFSLKTQFGRHVEFYETTDTATIISQLGNISKNNSRYNVDPFIKAFDDYNHRMQR